MDLTRIIVGISGASGIIYGVRLLEVLKKLGVETHLVITEDAERTLALETDYDINYVKSLANRAYDIRDMAALIASGSFRVEGMAVVPCSMKTLAGIALGYSENLLLRAAAVCIKEGRKLVLVPRETPLSPICLENMLKLAQIGVCILPASPPFYSRPKNIDDLVNHIVGRVLDIFGIKHQLYKRWGEV